MSRGGGDAARRLGELSELDPFAIEPGVIIGERFCVVGPVTHSERGWRVAATDLEREFGSAPHHRVEVHHLSLSRRDRGRLERAIRADAIVQPGVFMVVESLDGVDLVTQERKPLSSDNLDAESRVDLVLALTELLAVLHKNRVSGVRFSTSQLGRADGTLYLTSFAHVVADDGEAADVAALEAFIRDLQGEDAEPLLTPTPESADELSCRARAFLSQLPGAPVDALPSEAPFVGRERELEALRANYRNAVVARPSLMVIEGTRGVGKSRLVEEFEGWARTQTDALVVRGEFVESPNRHDTGMGEALSELGESLRRLDPVRAAELVKRLRDAVPEPGVLVKQVPALHDLIDAQQPPSFQLEDEFIRFTETISAFLLSVGAGPRPLVLVLENAEHADACTLGVLRHLAGAGPGSHLQVVLTVRGSTPDELVDAGAESLAVGPLGPGDISELITRSLHGAVEDLDGIGRELHASSEGLPLAAWVALQLWVKDSALRRDAGGSWRRDATKKPEFGVEVLLRHRLQRLDDAAREAAILLASREGVADLGWFADVGGTSTDEARHLLDALRQAGIVSRAQTGYRFWHDEVRRVVVESASLEQIQAAHHKLAKWLRGLPRASVAQLAYHEQLAGLDHEGLAVQHVQAAKEILEVYESRAAKWHLERALALELPANERIVAMELAGDASLLSGEAEQAADWYVKAIEEAESDLTAVALAGHAVRALYARAAGEAGIRVGTAALDRVGAPLPKSTPAKVLAFLHAFLAKNVAVRGMDAELRSAMCRLSAELSACLLVADPMNVGVAIVRSYRLARGIETGDAALATAFYGGLRGMMGHSEKAAEILEDARSLAERTDGKWALATSLHIRGQVLELPSDDYAQGQRTLDRAIECFRETGDLSVALLSLYFKSVYGYQREPAGQILEWLTETDALAIRHGNELARLETAALRLLVEARMGRTDIVAQAARLEVGIDRGKLVTTDVLAASTYTAAALLEAGEIDRAKARITSAMALTAALPAMPDVTMEVYSVFAYVFLAQPNLTRSDVRKVRRALRRLWRAGKKSPRLHAAYLLGAARLARRRGQMRSACLRAEQLRRFADLRGMRYMVAEAHLELFQALQGTEVLAAAEHARLAASLKGGLGYHGSLPEAAKPAIGELPEAATATSMRSLHAVPGELQMGQLKQLLSEVEASVLDALRSVPLTLHAEDGVWMTCGPSDLKSIATNLLLTARDAVPGIVAASLEVRSEVVSQSRASGLAGATAGTFAVLQARVRAQDGPAASSFGGLIGCRMTVNKAGGFLVVEPLRGAGLALSAYLPGGGNDTVSAIVPSRKAIVLNADAMTRRTIIAVLSRMGFECQDSGAVDEGVPPGAVVLGNAAALNKVKLGGDVKLIELVPRGAEAETTHDKLSVPFAVGDLEELVG
jgi:hypothetical protein